MRALLPFSPVAIRAAVCGLWTLLCLVAPAHATPPPPGPPPDEVLPPEAATVLSAAFDQLAPAWIADPVALNRDHVQATLCPAGQPQACLHVRLGAPEKPCANPTIGPFCPIFGEPATPPELLAQLQRALGPLRRESVWMRPAGSAPGMAPRPRPVPPRLWPQVIALVLAPLLLGALVGWRMRVRRPGRSRTAAAAALWLVLPVLVLTVGVAWFPLVGLWDVWQTALLFGLAGLMVDHAWFAPRFSVPVFAGTLLLGMAGLEVVARTSFGHPPAVDRQRAPSLWLPKALEEMPDLQVTQWSEREQVCRIVFGNDFEGMLDLDLLKTEVTLPATFRPRPVPRHTLHIGDSMVYGMGLERTQTVAAELSRLEPTVEHINAGIIGAGPDEYVALVDAWTERTAIDHVVVFLFEGNDLFDTNAPHPCTGGQSLMLHPPEGATQRPMTRYAGGRRSGLERLARLSPPPYLVRVLARDWVAGGWLAQLLTSWQQGDGMISAGDTRDMQKDYLRSDLRGIQRILKDRKIAWTVVILPSIPHLRLPERDRPIAVMREELGKQLGVRVLDAAPVLIALQDRGISPFFSPTDFHLSAAGHTALAEWLHGVGM